MFWGLLLEPGKRYSTTVEKSFHVSMAALDCSSVRNENEVLSVVLETEGSEALLCNLCKQMGILQNSLDLNFMAGDRVTFECRGNGRIHLSGYILPDDDDDVSGMLGDEESEEEDETGWSQTTIKEKSKKGKRKLDGLPDVSSKKKKTAKDEEDEESDSDGDVSDLSEMSDVGMDDEDLDDDDDDDEEVDDEDSDKDEDDDSDEEEDDDDVNLSKKGKQQQKQQKQQKPDNSKTPNKQNLDLSSNKKTPVTNGLSPKDQKANKNGTPPGNKTPNNQTPQQRKVLEMGVVVKEVKVGTGAPAKPGRTVLVHYLGKLRDGGKVFDKKLKGEPFKFKLGKGEVIKGWDIGLQGMKIGGKRIIHCPPEAAYGAKGVPPKIPANSALIFEVELKGVH